MRITSILFTVLFITSCASNNIRFVRKQTIPPNNQVQAEIKAEEEPRPKKTIIEIQEVKSEDNSDLASTENPVTSDSKKSNKRNLLLNNDSSKKSDEVDPEIIRSAARAEIQAKTSYAFSISGLISLILPYVGIPLIIAGWVFYVKSNRSRYITSNGQDKLRKSLTLLIIDGVIILAWVLFIGLLILF